ncbi:MAG: NADH-quinone oxidoreductase subunit L, partial [Zetaproteobacteria bacterium CG_4_9_14_3_um_filter_53_7]
LAGVPPFAGFFSKDLIIEATMMREFTEFGWVGTFASFAVLSGVFMTAFYTFRMFFLTFHNSDRVDSHTKHHLHESPKVITIPLVILAVGAVVTGLWGVSVLDVANPEIINGYFRDSIFVLDEHNPLMALAAEGGAHGALGLILHAPFTLPFWLAIGGIGLAYVMYFRETAMPAKIARAAGPLYTFLLNKWYWDEFYDWLIVRRTRNLGTFLWQRGDLGIIDKGIIHGGIIDSIKSGAVRMRIIQTGMVFHYAFAMVLGVFGLLTYLLLTA